MLKIYGRANSINVRKVLWAAEEIGLEYEREDWGRGFRATSEPDYRRLNPFGVVPTIDDDGYVLRESNSIVRYLATKHGRTDLFPEDLQLRFAVEAWMDWASTDLYDNVRPVMFAKVFEHPDFQDAKLLETAIAGWTRQMQLLDESLANRGSFLMGDEFTLADIPAGLVVNRWFSIEFSKPQLGQVSAYYDRLTERLAYRAHGRNGMP